MTAPLPRIPDTALLEEPDQQIRQLAYAVDAQIAATLKLSVLPPTQYTIDAAGRVTAAFPGIATISGCILQASTGSIAGQVATVVVPPPTIEHYLWGGPPDVVVESFPGGGQVRAVIFIPPEFHPGTYPWGYGAQLGGAGKTVSLRGIAWGPA